MKLKARIYVAYKVCGTVGHFPPYIQDIYKNILKYSRLNNKKFS